MKLNQMFVMFDYYKREAQTITRLQKTDIANSSGEHNLVWSATHDSTDLSITTVKVNEGFNIQKLP